MARILFYGDSPTVDTGFGVVSKNLLTRWAKKGHDITVLGINHFGNPYDQKKFPFPIWPCDKGPMEAVYGYAKFWSLEQQINPDIIFLLNDPWVIEKLYEFKPEGYESQAKVIAYYPTDAAPMQESWVKILNSFDAQVCYSQYAESVTIASNKGKRPKNLYQIYHGVDTSVFKPINQQVARTKANLPLDAFIVGMVARNQYRKRFDVVCQAFAEFAKDKPKAKLYLHTAVHDVGFDIPNLIRQFDLQGKLIVTKDLTPASGVPDSQLNIIYNTFDVNVLISLGDGFGLPVAESMAAGVPQVVSGHSCLQELVEGHGGLTVRNAAMLMNVGGFNTWGMLSDYKDLVKQLNVMYENDQLRLRYAEEGYNFITQERFTWDYAADQFNNIFNDKLHILQRAA
jgi:glycosyltransferase involved in cell wall biosynthesis